MPIPSSVALRPTRSVGQLPSNEPRTVPYSAEAMANPCIPGLRSQSDWIVCSAPEMTTVSKPNRNPARAEVTDQNKTRPLMAAGYPLSHRESEESSGQYYGPSVRMTHQQGRQPGGEVTGRWYCSSTGPPSH